CGRYADTADVVFGAVVSGRSPEVPDVERIAGLLINTVPVRVTWSDRESFADLLARLQQQALDSQPHHASKLADVQAQTGLRRDLIRHLVVFENYPVAPVASDDAGVQVAVVESSEPTGYDLLLLADPGAQLRLELQYNANAYSTRHVTSLARHLEQFLRNAVASPAMPVGSIEMLSPEECREIVAAGTGRRPDYPFDNLAEAFAAAAKAHATRTALAGEPTVGYADLDRRSNQLARHLVDAGVRPGDRVATLLERSPALIESILAIVKAGAAYVPLDPETPQDRVAFVLDDAGVKTVVAMTATQVRVPSVQRIAPDRDAAAIAAQSDAPLDVGRGRNDEVVLYYTSGSTGTPKAVCMPHRALLRLVLRTDYVQLGPADRVAHVSNVAFDAASFEIWGALLNGAELHPLGREVALTPAVLARELKGRGITAMFLTTALFNQVAREVPDAFSTLDAVLFGGELVDPAWVKRIIARGGPKRLLHVYGPTETGTFATWHEAREVGEGVTVPIGRPIANTMAFVIGRHGGVQPAGALGELFIGGDGLALGYHNRTELTAQAFVPHPLAGDGGRLYRTGDVVRRNLDGDIEFVGRRDAQVKLRGFRIEPGEVEAALRTCQGVVDAFVTVHQDEGTGDRRLIGYLAAPSAPRSLELDVRNHLRRRLPAYMIPSAFVIVDAFPMTPNGKLNRAALPAPTRSGMGFGRTFSAPSGELETQLAAIWQATLGVAAVGRQDNFFELGGHSLTASTAVSRIRAELKVDVPIAAFFEAPTLESLATLVAGLRETKPAASTITRVARETTTR
ncbi:MAG: amino acid adenylation domain-containing protein, partial [Vicinamibacterales bacterium]